jgi:hypothetical protein
MLNIGLQQFETPAEQTGSAFGNLKTSYWEAQGANIASSWDYNPTSSLFRLAEQTEAYNESNIYLNKDELNKEYADIGLFFEQDTREGVVDYLVKRKQVEQERASVVNRGPQNAYGTFFLASLATNFADPINIGSAFIPVVGQTRFANMVARSGKNVARLQRGFIEGFVGNAAVEPIVYGVARSEQSDYDQYDAFFNIAAGGILGSSLHVGFGKIGDVIAEKTGKPNIYQRLAAISPENQQDLLRYSVGKTLRGEKVDTGDFINSKTRIGDEQLNRIDDQINEFKDLYKNAVDKNDITSARIYLDNLRNLQKTERELFEAKKQKNDLAVQQRLSDPNIRDEKGLIPESDITYQAKKTSEIEIEAENMNKRNVLHQKQLNIKDEDLSDDFLEDRKKISDISNVLSKKVSIRDSIDAGINCVIRNI